MASYRITTWDVENIVKLDEKWRRTRPSAFVAYHASVSSVVAEFGIPLTNEGHRVFALARRQDDLLAPHEQRCVTIRGSGKSVTITRES